MNTISVTFNDFSLDGYIRFLAVKQLPEKNLAYDWEQDTYSVQTPARFAKLLGMEVPPAPSMDWTPSPHLYESQRHVVREFLDIENFDCFADCGLGKTSIALEAARACCEMEPGSKSLIMTPLNVVPEFFEEREKFFPDLDLKHLKTRAEAVEWLLSDAAGVAIINTEKMAQGKIPEFNRLNCFILDEASVLKTIGGTIKWNIIHSTRAIPRRLGLTATPAPNDVWEYASQAGFLGRLKDKDPEFWGHFKFNDETRSFEIKAHAREAFYRHLASWSIYLRNPAAYGFSDARPAVPDPVYIEHKVPATEEQMGLLMDVLNSNKRGLIIDEAKLDMKLRTQLAQMARGFLYKTGQNIESRKPEKVVEVVMEELAAGRQVILWTIFDDEARILEALLRDRGVAFGGIHGHDDPEARVATLKSFKAGEIRLLITKPSLLAFGVNLQACGAMVFSGFDDSYERLYQAVRRACRPGQTLSVRLHFVFIPELEGQMLANLMRKRVRFDNDCIEMERAYASVLRMAA